MTVQASALDLASTPVVAVRPELDAMSALHEITAVPQVLMRFGLPAEPEVGQR
ncbi:hypothetical protein ACWEV3_31390 [Saccharopolyspora sp. NPDC003752]